jgi:hypothetical protein
MFSLTVKGTPCNGGRSAPAAIARSAAFAAASASSAMPMTTALIDGLTASIRRRWASTTSWLEACLDRMAAASSVALWRHSSVALLSVTTLFPSGVGRVAE